MERSLRCFEVIHIIVYSRYPLTIKKSTHWNTSTIETQDYSMAEKRRKKRGKSFRVWTPNSRTETKFEIFTANDTQPPRTVVSWSHNALLAGHTRTLEIGKHRLDTVFEKKKKNCREKETDVALFTHLTNVAPHYYFAGTDDSILDRSCTIHSVALWFFVFSEKTVREIEAPPSVCAPWNALFVFFLTVSRNALTFVAVFVAVCLYVVF